MTKQCAWCKSIMVNGIKIKQSNHIISGMSHGICLSCKKSIEMVYHDEKKGFNGDILSAINTV
jgi:hypothetical protein